MTILNRDPRTPSPVGNFPSLHSNRCKSRLD